MEIKLNIKAPGKADVNFEFSCNADETAALINDPVYQNLGAVLIEHVRHENEALRRKAQQSQYRGNRQGNDRVDALRRVMETEVKRQSNHNEAVNKAIHHLQDEVSRMLDNFIRNNIK